MVSTFSWIIIVLQEAKLIRIHDCSINAKYLFCHCYKITQIFHNNYLRKKGYKFDKEHVIIEGIPVQFIPVYNELVNEAVLKSVEAKYGRIKTKVLVLEYLAAIMIQTYRTKDRERLIKIFEEAEVDLRLLRKILKKYNLHDKYTEFRRRYFDNE